MKRSKDDAGGQVRSPKSDERPLRIGIDARKLLDYGIGRYLEGLLKALARRQDQHEYILFVRSAHQDALPGDLSRVFTPERFRLVTIDAPLYSLAELFAFRGTGKRFRLDVMHFPHYVRPFAVGCPVSVLIHDAIHLQMPPSFLAQAYARTMMGWAVRSADLLLTGAEAAREDLETLLPESRGRWTVVHDGVDQERFAPPTPEALHRFRRDFDLTSPFVLLMGSHRPHKNLAQGVAAFVLAELPHTQLVVPARDEVAAERLRPLVAAAPGVRLFTPCSDDALRHLYAAADVVLIPSLHEGFGLTGLEACAAGGVVLATPISAHREVLQGAVELASGVRAEDLSTALRTLAHDASRRAHLQSLGPHHASRFLWEHTAEGTLAAFQSLAERESRMRS